MVAPASGAVVVLHFPFSDLSETKLRPAIVLATIEQGDYILCQVTSNPWGDTGAIKITPDDLATGTLRLVSFARPGKLFTANLSLLISQAAVLKAETRDRVVESVVTLLRAGRSGSHP